MKYICTTSFQLIMHRPAKANIDHLYLLIILDESRKSIAGFRLGQLTIYLRSLLETSVKIHTFFLVLSILVLSCSLPTSSLSTPIETTQVSVKENILKGNWRGEMR